MVLTLWYWCCGTDVVVQAVWYWCCGTGVVVPREGAIFVSGEITVIILSSPDGYDTQTVLLSHTHTRARETLTR